MSTTDVYAGMARAQSAGTIDLRSDTVTLPTPAMRKAMYEAEVGDDVYGEDPTANRLEAMAAERFGKEAALIVSSGTQGNLVSLLAHCGRSTEAIVGKRSHIFLSEQGGAAALGGITLNALDNQPDGTLKLDEVEGAVRADNEHYARTRLIAIENTQNSVGGRAITPEYMQSVGALARKHGLALHVDGARIFNAAVALNVDARTLTNPADSVTFCLSKGLACPIGSVIVGSQDFIKEARRARKQVGGGMRQVGIFAAAGIVALSEMIERLDDDHRNARRLAGALAELPGITINPTEVETNLIFFELISARLAPAELSAQMKARGILMGGGPSRRIRLVTHYGIEAADIDRTIEAFRAIMAG